ncbi:MAG: cob(I)yrinic acid a,c-diamide adenosyltransferase [Candidatus Thermoplasmatota archaeon]|nr:cob(I)yrinic acid a,c-diamide adenosyltransferase [Candidatus Thermoplasmatota archaeon]
MKTGLIHIYTGTGKGKTTAALGLGLRASGAGYKVHMIQFMKGRRYSEIDALEHQSHFSVSQHGRDDFVNKENPEQIDIDMAQEGFKYAKKIINNNKYDMIILDEINVAVDFNLIKLDEILRTMDEKPAHLELIFTGRYAHPEVIRKADLVTEMLEIKHPYQKGIKSRKGIDF